MSSKKCYAPSIGGFSRPMYDGCEYRRRVHESTTPLSYQLYEGKFQNCNKCTHNGFWRPFDPEIVALESELKNLTRPASRCPELKYHPDCKRSSMCTSTFEPRTPHIVDRNLCPVVYNNIRRMTSPGYSVPSGNMCGGW